MKRSVQHTSWLGALAALVALAPATRAEFLVGVTASDPLNQHNSVFAFSSHKPTPPLFIRTLAGLTSGEALVGIDFRPNSSVAYAVGYSKANSTGQLYLSNAADTALTKVGSSADLDGATAMADHLRRSADLNTRLSSSALAQSGSPSNSGLASAGAGGFGNSGLAFGAPSRPGSIGGGGGGGGSGGGSNGGSVAFGAPTVPGALPGMPLPGGTAPTSTDSFVSVGAPALIVSGSLPPRQLGLLGSSGGLPPGTAGGPPPGTVGVLVSAPAPASLVLAVFGSSALVLFRRRKAA